MKESAIIFAYTKQPSIPLHLPGAKRKPAAAGKSPDPFASGRIVVSSKRQPISREDKDQPPAIIRRSRISSPSRITRVSYSAARSCRPLIQTAALRIFLCLISWETVVPDSIRVSFLLMVTSIISPTPIPGQDAGRFPASDFRFPRPNPHTGNTSSVCVQILQA